MNVEGHTLQSRVINTPPTAVKQCPNQMCLSADFVLRRRGPTHSLISQEGMRVNPARLQMIQDFHLPSSKTAIRHLLGLANQFGINIRKFADIIAPLTALTKKGWPATWTRDQVPEGTVAAFRKLKEVL